MHDAADIERLIAPTWQRLQALAAQESIALDAHVARLQPVLLASAFAAETLLRQPSLLRSLLQDDGATTVSAPVLSQDNAHEWPRLLRWWRQAESTRLVWRDVLGLDDVEATLAGSTRLAEACLQHALEALETQFAQRHGVVRDEHGELVRLVVFGLGKLGGGELNFSSDVDLVYAYAAEGESDGARALPAETYFARLGQQLAKLLDEVTADGFSHRVDLRLRPYGQAGRIAWSFAGLDAYFQREGRDWERYAWQKARPVAGAIAAGQRFLQSLRPFVYRKYLDFGALEGLREMKALIDAEVTRRELADDVKRGPGGIREIEFLVQALQLIRGGREPALQTIGLLPSLARLVEAGHVEAATARRLADAYRFLRRLENRLQMRHDAQTHVLPENETERAHVAMGLCFADWPALLAALAPHRANVAAEFAALLRARERKAQGDEGIAAYWRLLPDAGEPSALADAGFEDVGRLDVQLRDFLRSATARQSSDIARSRLDRVMPALIAAAAASSQPDAALERALKLVQNILRRSSYLVLLDEQPRALQRLVDALSRSALLGERLSQHPLLLDELLDARGRDAVPDAADMHGQCMATVRAADGDVDAALRTLNELRLAISFRIALAVLDGRQPAGDSTRQLAELADAVLAAVLHLAEEELRAAHGGIAGARFAVVGYGSLGGRELGFGSDLDLVFLYEAPPDAVSDGARPLEASRWFARLAQKIVGYLQTPTAGGRLYDVDVRLRPDGSKAMLVSTLESYADYQRTRAWSWEHQALVRAHAVAGDAGLRAAFESVREDVLRQPRDAQALCGEVLAMRQRMRHELDRSDARFFDLKQGEGGLVDLEFLLQYAVLARAADAPRLCEPRDTPGLLDALAATALWPAEEVAALRDAHALLLEAGLRCTLDRRKRISAQADADIGQARAAIIAACAAHGLAFGPKV